MVRPRPVDGWGPAVSVNPPISCQVLAAGEWHPGQLTSWRRHREQGWSAQVSWSTAAGLRHIGWRWADEVRPTP